MNKVFLTLPEHTSGDTLEEGILNITLFTDAAKTIPFDLTGYRVDMQFRERNSPDSRLVLNLSTANGKMVISGANNNVIRTLEVSALEMELKPRIYKGDLQITSAAGVVTTIAVADLPILSQVTKI